MMNFAKLVESFDVEKSKKSQFVDGYDERRKTLILWLNHHYKNVIKSNYGRLVINEDNELQLSLIINYFSGHPEFYECKKTVSIVPDYSLEKSLFIYGPLGCGKTEIMLAVMRVLPQIMNNEKDETQKHFWEEMIFSHEFANEFTQQFSSDGYDMLKRFKRNQNIFIDDIGAERDSSNYADKNILVGSDVLLIRYNMTKFSDFKTHYTTNLPIRSDSNEVQTMESFYGKREANRFYETHNIITFGNTSKNFRKI